MITIRESYSLDPDQVWHFVGPAGFQAGPTFPIFPTFPYFFDLLLLFPTFSLKCPTIPTFSLWNAIHA